jgi:hypothetical protein
MTANESEELLPPHQREMIDVVAVWMNRSLAKDGTAELANERARRVLYRHLINLPEPPTSEFSAEVRAQGDVIMGYLALTTLLYSFRECEHYFRRYPFGGIAVGRADHLRNCCEMYCDRFAQFRDRMKATLNGLKRFQSSAPVADFLKAFDKSFAWEIRMRNHVHHRGRFDDDTINQLSMVELFERVGTQHDLFVPRPHVLYRKASREWVERVRNRSEHLGQFLEAIAGLILSAEFVQPLRSQVSKGNSAGTLL